MLALLVLSPVLAAATVAVFGWRRATAVFGVGSAAILLVGGTALAPQLSTGPVVGVGGLLRADALSVFMVIVIGAISLLANVFAIPYLAAERALGHTTSAGERSYGILVQLFQAAMVLAVLASNLGVMWVAVEATTISTVFLVGHRRTRTSLEASWKYLIIGGVGIALAFLGTALLAFSARAVPGAGGGLDWLSLTRSGDVVDPGVVRIAVGLLVLGYGTKVGLAPMHTWLPDAHSQAPAPVSALMSGVLLAVAFYGLLRVKVIADAALGVGFVRGLLIGAGLLSLAVSASLLIAQRDYKRMLAYHSIEHMGLITLGAAAGTPLAIGGVLLHILGHGLAKSVLFLTTGEMMLAEGSTRIDRIHALVARRPILGGTFGIGLFALLGLPPFSLFVSELAMIRGEWSAGLGWVVAVQVTLMLVIFGAVSDHGRHMLLGAGELATDRRVPMMAAGTLVGGLVACVLLGLSAWPVQSLIVRAASIVTGAR